MKAVSVHIPVNVTSGIFAIDTLQDAQNPPIECLLSFAIGNNQARNIKLDLSTLFEEVQPMDLHLKRNGQNPAFLDMSGFMTKTFSDEIPVLNLQSG